MDARRFTLLTATGISNSSSRYALRRAAGRGRLLRIRRGVYISAVDWQQARAWERYRISAAAIAIQTPDTIFCRQTALTLRGLPLLSVPREIFRRTFHKSQVGRLNAEELPMGAVSGRCAGFRFRRHGGCLDRMLMLHTPMDP